MRATRARKGGPRGWSIVAGAVAVLAAAGLVLGALAIHGNAGAATGESNSATWLADFEETGVLSSTTPIEVPAPLSLLPAAPTRLPGVLTSYRLNGGVGGHEAVEWTFSERVGIPANQELEIAFAVQYEVGGVGYTAAVTVYAESQAAVLAAALTFDLFWDAGAAAGITFASESEIVQPCSGVGACP